MSVRLRAVGQIFLFCFSLPLHTKVINNKVSFPIKTQLNLICFLALSFLAKRTSLDGSQHRRENQRDQVPLPDPSSMIYTRSIFSLPRLIL